MIYEKELSDKIIDISKRVYAELGAGFLEKVYENSLMHDFGKSRLHAEQQFALPVVYDGICVGEYFADILVDDKVIVEIKAARALALENEAQLLNYLKATDIEVGLLINFGPKPAIKRKVFDNFRK